MTRSLAPNSSGSRRLAVTLLALFGAAFVARVATWLTFPDPAYPDSYYYVAVARELAAGHGFEVGFIWNFVDVGGHLPAVASLPIPSNAHWMPLASIVQVPFIWLLGPTAFASGLPFWILGALAAPLTYLVGRDAGLGKQVSTAAAALMILPAGAAPYLAQPDNFALYMVLGMLALWACARGLRGDRRAFALGGLAVGLATLARTDGVLLGVPFAIAFAMERWRAWHGRSAGSAGMTGMAGAVIGWRAATACFGLFLLVVGPWLLRDLAVFGSIAPSSASGRILWIRNYQQLFSVGDQTTLSTFLAQGPLSLVASRIGGLVAAVIIVGGTPLLFFLVPLVLVGAWQRGRDPAFRPWAIYAITFFLSCGLIFAVHVPYGMALHSGLALVPHAYLLAFVGLAATVRWVSARRRGWHAEQATRNLGILAIAVCWVMAGVASLRLSAEWSSETSDRVALLHTSEPIPAGDLLMSSDPGAFWYRLGIEGVVTPDDPLPEIERTARLYGVRWLAIERDHAVPALLPVLNGSERPAWLSAPVSVVGADAAGGAAPATERVGGSTTGTNSSVAEAGGPRMALYAVCTDPADSRCAGNGAASYGASGGTR